MGLQLCGLSVDWEARVRMNYKRATIELPEIYIHSCSLDPARGTKKFRLPTSMTLWHCMICASLLHRASRKKRSRLGLEFEARIVHADQFKYVHLTSDNEARPLALIRNPSRFAWSILVISSLMVKLYPACSQAAYVVNQIWPLNCLELMWPALHFFFCSSSNFGYYMLGRSTHCLELELQKPKAKQVDLSRLFIFM